MKICILGAGSLGCAIGAALSEARSDVWLINRSAVQVDRLNSFGLTVVDAAGERKVQVKAATACTGLSPVDLLIVLVKSYHTREAIEAAGPVVDERTIVMSLQNGLGHEDILCEVIGRRHVVGGKTYVGGMLLGPGRVFSGIAGKQTYIGELDGTISERVTRVAAEFNRAGLDTIVSANIVGMIWDKLLVNVATGALSSITRLPYGALYAVPEVKATALAAVAEAMAVARAAGVTLSFVTAEEPWVRAGVGLPPDFKASMLQSLEQGRLTEIDYINGAVVRWGERHGVATPVNATLVGCIKGIERTLS